MASTAEYDSSTQYFESLRGYVLSPFPTALRIISHEREQVKAELRAFETFLDRVEEIECEPPQWRHADGIDGAKSRKLPKVRDAYQQTVMSVDHYDEVYNNTLFADVEAEFGSELAAVVHPTTETSFTERTRGLVVTAAKNSIQQRTAMLERLDAEEQSLETAQEQIRDFVEELDGAHIPYWYAKTFLTRIDEVACNRQAMIRRTQTSGFTNGHQLCEYLYADERWTYPVLTGLGRLRETIVVPEK